MKFFIQQSTANPEHVKDGKSVETFSVFFWWVCGISLLTLALFISARMGIYQEVLYKRFGKYPREALYITVCAKISRVKKKTAINFHWTFYVLFVCIFNLQLYNSNLKNSPFALYLFLHIFFCSFFFFLSSAFVTIAGIFIVIQ